VTIFTSQVLHRLCFFDTGLSMKKKTDGTKSGQLKSMDTSPVQKKVRSVGVKVKFSLSSL